MCITVKINVYWLRKKWRVRSGQDTWTRPDPTRQGLDPTRIFCQYSGPDPTQPDPRVDPTREQLCCVLMIMQRWTEAPVDAMVLSLYRLSRYYACEISRARSGQGNYTLRSGLVATSEAWAVDPSQAAPSSPSTIVDRIRYGRTRNIDSPAAAAASNVDQPLEQPSPSNSPLPLAPATQVKAPFK